MCSLDEPSYHGNGFRVSQNLGGVEEIEIVRQLVLDEGPHHAASAFHEKAGDLVFSTFLQQARKIACAPRSRQSQHDNSGGLQFLFFLLRGIFIADCPHRNFSGRPHKMTGGSEPELTIQNNANRLAARRPFAKPRGKLRVVGKGGVDADQNAIRLASQLMHEAPGSFIADPAGVSGPGGNPPIEGGRNLDASPGEARWCCA